MAVTHHAIPPCAQLTLPDDSFPPSRERRAKPATGRFPLAKISNAEFIAVTALITAMGAHAHASNRRSRRITLAALSVVFHGRLPFALFAIGMALLLSAQTLVTPNLNSVAMLPHGNLAGLAAGVLGMISTIGGAILGTITSQLHDGSTRTITSAIALFLVAAAVCIGAGRRNESQHDF